MNAQRLGFVLGLAGLAALAFAACAPSDPQPRTATAIIADATGKVIGSALFTETTNGTRVTVRVRGFSMARHGTHLHENPSCTDTKDAAGNPVKFGGAGPHFDPMGTMTHGSPDGTDRSNHAGDLENLVVDKNSNGLMSMTNKHITVSSGMTSVVGRSIVIHANEDRFTNDPPNGGSGARIACGVIVVSK